MILSDICKILSIICFVNLNSSTFQSQSVEQRDLVMPTLLHPWLTTGDHQAPLVDQVNIFF